MQGDEPLFDLAALEEGQDPLEAKPLHGRKTLAELALAAGPPPGTPSGALPGTTAPFPPGGPHAARAAPLPLASLPAAPPRFDPEAPPAAEPPPAPAPAAPPLPPPSLTGLSAAEVADRTARGLLNRITIHERSDREIIRDNVLTFFNVVLGSLIAVLFVLAIVDQDASHAQDGLFVGIVVVANVAVGTFQEVRATRALRRLVALTAPRATAVREGEETAVAAADIVQGDLIHLRAGDQVVADGPVVAEVAEIDQSLLTGESASVRKQPGDPLLSGSFCTAGACYYTAQKVGMAAYANSLTSAARQLVRRETPLQLRFRRILRLLLIVTAALGALLLISAAVAEDEDLADAIKATTATISSVVPEGLLLGLTVAFAVGAVRLSRRGAIVQDINAVEAMNYMDVVCLDKTGTITANRLTLRKVHWAPGAEPLRPWLGAFAAATVEESRTAAALAEELARSSNGAQPAGGVPFNSERRWSALRLQRGAERRTFVLGAPETLFPHCRDAGALQDSYETAAANGLRGVLFAESAALPDPDTGLGDLRAAALVTLADVLRPEVTTAFATMREIGVEPKIISGDNPHTVAALVRQLGIDLKGGAIAGPQLAALDDDAFSQAVEDYSVFGRIAPDQKARIVRQLRARRHFVAMIGDGANDVPALRAADIAVAMESGTQSARAVAGIVLRNDSFAAFVYGTAEAQNVLGNSAQLSKLFITKSFYAFLIIFASNLLGLDFPFLPRHGSLTALFTLGIPSIFIAITTPPSSAGRDFTNSILRFALPASLALAGATIAVHLLTEGFLGRSIEVSRTLVSLTIGIVGIYFMVQVLGFEGISLPAPIRRLRRPLLTTFFGIFLLGLFILTLYTPPLRNFFDFRSVGVDEWSIVVPAVLAAMVGQYVISRRWRQIVGWVVKQPAQEELGRGRAL